MAKCRGCSADIQFVETARGKLMPIDPDGTSHFATCPQVTQFRKPAAPDDTCAGCGSKNVERLPGKGQHYAAIKCRECGQHRWLRLPA